MNSFEIFNWEFYILHLLDRASFDYSSIWIKLYYSEAMISSNSLDILVAAALAASTTSSPSFT